jgi:hypothetical protein
MTMAFVKAATSPRARKYLATAEGRRQLLETYLSGSDMAIRVDKSGQMKGHRLVTREESGQKK